MKKFIIRLIAAIPALAALISTALSFCFSFEWPIAILLALGNSMAAILLLSNFENTVKQVKDFLKILVDETIVYE